MEPISETAAWVPSDRHRHRFIRPRRLLLVLDMVAACAAFIVVYVTVRLRGTVGNQLTVTLLTSGTILVLSLALLLRSRQYSTNKRLAFLPALWVLATDVTIAAGTTTLISYLTRGYFTGATSPSRLAVGLAVTVFAAVGLLVRLLLTLLQRSQYAAGKGVRNILVAGDGTTASELEQLISERPDMGVAVAGRIRLDIPEWRGTAGGSGDGADAVSLTDDLDGLRRFDKLLRSSRATEVLVALDPEDQSALNRLATFLSLAHVPFRVVPALFEETYLATEVLGLTDIPVVDLFKTPLDRVGRIVKRTVDISFALLVLILLLPLHLTVVAAIVLTSGWPVVFTQERVGKNGRHFTLYKFRTMVKDAESRLKEVEAKNELAASDGLMFKMRRDPRVTRVGSLLRRLSLDELPQFLNVLKGDMSVVGPRPPLPREVTNYERDHLYRLRVLPGITGLWQVSGRNELDFEDMVMLDRYYVDNWSLWMDFRIIMRTFYVLVSRQGAY